jgi:hypothetical protein
VPKRRNFGIAGKEKEEWETVNSEKLSLLVKILRYVLKLLVCTQAFGL